MLEYGLEIMNKRSNVCNVILFPFICEGGGGGGVGDAPPSGSRFHFLKYPEKLLRNKSEKNKIKVSLELC